MTTEAQKTQTCSECGGDLEVRPLALRCTSCKALFRKPGVIYENDKLEPHHAD